MLEQENVQNVGHLLGNGVTIGKDMIMPSAKPLISVCAWCTDAAERTAEAQAQGYNVTHTICTSCAAHVLSEVADND